MLWLFRIAHHAAVNANSLYRSCVSWDALPEILHPVSASNPEDIALHNLSNPFRLAYEFTVPFHAGRVVTVHQASTSNGKTVTLERIVIAPSETRIYLDGLSYFNITAMQQHMSDNNDITLTAGDQTYRHLGSIVIGDPAARRSVISVLEPLANDKHGTWTLHIPDPTKGSGWTFRFSV